MENKPPQPLKLSDLLKNYEPRPSTQFYRRMAQTPWNQKENNVNTLIPNRRLGWQFALALLIALAALSLTLPPVRAALSAWLGLSIAPANTQPSLSTNTLITVEKPAELPQLSTQAGWQILAATQLPQGYSFSSAYYDPTNHMVSLSYFATRPLPGSTDTETKALTLIEALRNDVIPLQIAPSTLVQDVTLNGQPAAYAKGAWDSSFDAASGQNVSTWRNDLEVQNVFWQVGSTYFVLITDDTTLTQADLLGMAASVGQ
jgi:hypothetical protein